jgi:hypothetical protein
MIGYGSGDQIPRVKMLPFDHVQALFPPSAPEFVKSVKRRSEL